MSLGAIEPNEWLRTNVMVADYAYDVPKECDLELTTMVIFHGLLQLNARGKFGIPLWETLNQTFSFLNEFNVMWVGYAYDVSRSVWDLSLIHISEPTRPY